MWQHITVIPELGGRDKSQEVALNLLPAHMAKPENSRFNEKLSSKMSREQVRKLVVNLWHTDTHIHIRMTTNFLKHWKLEAESFQGNLVLPYAKEILSSLTLRKSCPPLRSCHPTIHISSMEFILIFDNGSKFFRKAFKISNKNSRKIIIYILTNCIPLK